MTQKTTNNFIRLGHEDESEGGAGVITRSETHTQKPSLYQVILLNDDYTPMDFVIQVLENFFNKTHEDATEIMLAVHTKGRGLCGVYSRDVAETKSSQVNDAAQVAGHPLQCVAEKL